MTKLIWLLRRSSNDGYHSPADSRIQRPVLSTLLEDLRFAARVLAKSPLLTVVVALCIAIGTGAVTTIVSVMNALILEPVSGTRDAARLIRVERKVPNENDGVSASYPLYEYLGNRTRALSGLAAWGKGTFTIGRPGTAGSTVYGNFVTPNFFSVLGVRPVVGRLFVAGEASAAIVVSEGFWRTVLGGDTTLVGREILVNGRRFTLVGVAPAAFRGTDDPIKTDVWTPLAMRQVLDPSVGSLANTSQFWLRLAGRLAPNATAEVAHRELSSLTTAFNAEGTEPAWLKKYSDLRVAAFTGLPPDATKPLGGFLAILLGAAGLVLLIASINVGAMLSARAIARRREMAVRAALGAARGRLVRQLLTEILVLFGIGAAGGMALAVLGTKALERMPIPAEITFAPALSPDARVFAFTIVIALVTGVIVGLAPARRATSVDVAAQLREGAAAGSARRTWLGNALVVGQLATSLLLLVDVGLFVRALQHAARIHPGFDANNVITAQLDAETWGYDQAQAHAFYRELHDRAERLPGVTGVTYTAILPLTLRSHVEEMRLQGQGDAKLPMRFLEIGDGFLSVLRIPLVAGRDFAATDDERAPKVAIVNEAFARRFAADQSALGRVLRFRGEPVTIVGVVRDVKLYSLAEQVGPGVFFPLAQRWDSKRAIMLRGGGDAHALATALQAIVRDLDPAAPRPTVVPLLRAMSIGIMPQRIAAAVTGTLGIVGLMLATIGLYGIIAYSTSRRAREIGIRLALGARHSDILSMVLREGMRLTIGGVVLGLVLSAAASRLVASLLFGVSPMDAVTFSGMAALLAVVALAATWIPARRAASANPMVVLRSE